MSRVRRVVVIGASAGGLEALRQLVGGLPPDFDAPVCLVQHVAAESPGIIPDILDRAGPLPASLARSGDSLRPGHIYVAPPDRHLLLEPGRLRLTRGPRENRFRPAIDPLFRSAAQVYGPAAIGVILTGRLDDGAAGLWFIKQLGGVAIVQDPRDAPFPSMPQHAAAAVHVDYSVPIQEMAALLARLATTPAGEPVAAAAADRLGIEVRIAAGDNALDAGVTRLGGPSVYSCPDCHGVMLQIDEGGRVRFRCHTGHAYSVHSLLAAMYEGMEKSLWSAIRVFEEAELLMQHLAGHLDEARHADAARRYAAEARELKTQVDALRAFAGRISPSSLAGVTEP
jgi:two-component system, chemotaxis family, protein-glutamate methylesterase/glutaminase